MRLPAGPTRRYVTSPLFRRKCSTPPSNSATTPTSKAGFDAPIRSHPFGARRCAPVHVAPLHSYSAKIDTLAPAALTDFIHTQLDRAGLPHTTFTEDAINLICRSSEGTLRAVKNLCIGALIEAVRDQTKTVDLKQVNAVLLQPHWRHNQQNEPAPQGIIFTNQPPVPGAG